MYLVDTNVLSTGPLGRQERHAEFIGWLDARSDALFLSAVTVTEVCDGIARS